MAFVKVLCDDCKKEFSIDERALAQDDEVLCDDCLDDREDE